MVPKGCQTRRRRRPRQPAVEQCHQLAPRRQPADPGIRPVGLHKALELGPRHMLQKVPEYTILMRHDVVPLRCPDTSHDARDTEESTSCTLSTEIKPDTRGQVSGPDVDFLREAENDSLAQSLASHLPINARQIWFSSRFGLDGLVDQPHDEVTP